MKKVLTVVISMFLVCALAVGTVGCGGNSESKVENEETKENKTSHKETISAKSEEEFIEILKGIIDLSLYKESEGGFGKSFKYNDAPAVKDVTQVKIGKDSTVNLPCTLKDLEKGGWTPVKPIKKEIQKLTSYEFVNASNDKVTLAIYNDENVNPSDGESKFDGIILAKYYLHKVVGSTEIEKEDEECPEFNLEGLTKNSDIYDVFDCIGLPNNIKFDNSVGTLELMYITESNNRIFITIDRSNGALMVINCQ